MARVLIVDDEPSIRDTLSEFVKEDGHNVVSAEDAAAAIAILQRDPPDVVVTDIILPRATGVTLLRQIHEIAPDIQVIMITGEPTAETAAEAVRLGAFDYLSKPIMRDDFKSAVASALRVSELAKRKRELEAENLRYREHLEEEVAKTSSALLASEVKYRTVVEHANEAIFVVDGGVIAFANPETLEIVQRPMDDVLGRQFTDFVDPQDHETVTTAYLDAMEDSKLPPEIRIRIRRPNEEQRWLSVRGVSIEWEGRRAVLGFANDVTLRIEAELEEREREERIRRANDALLQLAKHRLLYEGNLEAALDLIIRRAADVLEVDQVLVSLPGPVGAEFSPEKVYVRSEASYRDGRSVPPEDIPAFLEELRKNRVLAIADISTDPLMEEFDVETLKGRGIASVLDAAIFVGGEVVGDVTFEHVGETREWTHEDKEFAGDVAALVALTLESAQRKRTEQELQRREKEYEALFEDSPVSLWYEDFSDVKTYLDKLRASGITDLRAHLRVHPDTIDECISRIRIVDVNETTLTMHEADSKEELLLGLGQVLTESSRMSVGEQLIAIWGGERFFEDTTIDRTIKGNSRHVAIRWAVPPGYEETLERVLLAKTDITAVIEAEREVRRALDGTIEAIGRTTETRDPYTAGHQRRVTALAVAVAEELGLESVSIEGTRAAGLLHDIGKMAIPAEILSKPSRLTDMEMALIRAHPQVAYDILKSISFPWPLAEIVVQHHERIDGSGYPQGLRGEGILTEARILSVADTVEAMASHRPYRAALGIDSALAEIEAQRGTQYDPDVVDACLELFRSGRFAFDDTDAPPG